MTDETTYDNRDALQIADKIQARLRSDISRPAGGGTTKTFVLMSGGVDSTVSAVLALRAGLDVTGVTMRQFDDDSAVRAAAEVCGELGIESWAFDLRAEFQAGVVAPFLAAYRRGETPNPCALCNPTIKFGLLWDRIAERCREDFHVITGHYAKILHRPEGSELRRGAWRAKDQSYFLCMLPQRRIDRLLLPLGSCTKAQTRGLAAVFGRQFASLRKAGEKPESMEICFLSGMDYRELMGESGAPGPIVDAESGATLGIHKGIENFTVGQRKGLGLTSREPLFVTRIDPATNTVAVSRRAAAFASVIHASGVNVLAAEACRDGARLEGKIRSQAEAAPCTVRIADKGITATFDTPQFAPAPGQYLVLYEGERVVAGGPIRGAE